MSSLVLVFHTLFTACLVLWYESFPLQPHNFAACWPFSLWCEILGSSSNFSVVWEDVLLCYCFLNKSRHPVIAFFLPPDNYEDILDKGRAEGTASVILTREKGDGQRKEQKVYQLWKMIHICPFFHMKAAQPALQSFPCFLFVLRPPCPEKERQWKKLGGWRSTENLVLGWQRANENANDREETGSSVPGTSQ